MPPLSKWNETCLLITKVGHPREPTISRLECSRLLIRNASGDGFSRESAAPPLPHTDPESASKLSSVGGKSTWTKLSARAISRPLSSSILNHTSLFLGSQNRKLDLDPLTWFYKSNSPHISPVVKMDAYSISYTTPSGRGSSRIYQDLATCRLAPRNYSTSKVEQLNMKFSEKVSTLSFFSAIIYHHS
jgi:hypothetical protein